MVAIRGRSANTYPSWPSTRSKDFRWKSGIKLTFGAFSSDVRERLRQFLFSNTWPRASRANEQRAVIRGVEWLAGVCRHNAQRGGLERDLLTFAPLGGTGCRRHISLSVVGAGSHFYWVVLIRRALPYSSWTSSPTCWSRLNMRRMIDQVPMSSLLWAQTTRYHGVRSPNRMSASFWGKSRRVV